MTAETKRKIFRLASEGLSHRAIARLVDSTHATVAKVLAGPVPAPLEEPAHMARTVPAKQPDDAPADDAPALEQARYLMREAREALRAANASCDPQLAQRQTRNAAFLANVLARLERADQESSGGFLISPEEIAAAKKKIDDVMTALAAREGLRCKDCDRKLSVFWGTGTSE